MRVETIGNATIHVGDCTESMRTMPNGCVNTCITSPPYFGLRDYGHDDQIGLEATPDEYIAKMVEVFREVRRVLRDDGTLWLNIGDSYGSGKQLIGIPWRLALALQADSWVLRQDIIWSKPNPMPESVIDRCTKAHEYIFLLSKSGRYHYDHEAIKEPVATSTVARLAQNVAGQKGSDRVPGKTNGTMKAVRSKANSFRREESKRSHAIPGQSVGTHRPDRAESEYDTDTRNKRSVWTVATKPFSGAHFAVFPPELIIPCVLAGCPVGGTVLDPFGGSGTTGIAAVENSRKAILCELNPDYAAMAALRIDEVQRQERLFA